MYRTERTRPVHRRATDAVKKAFYGPGSGSVRTFFIFVLAISFLIPFASYHQAVLDTLVFLTAGALYYSSTVLSLCETYENICRRDEATQEALRKVKDLPPSTPLVWSQVGLSVVHIPRNHIPSRCFSLIRLQRKIGLAICLLYLLQWALGKTLMPITKIVEYIDTDGNKLRELYELSRPLTSKVPTPTPLITRLQSFLYESGSRVMNTLSAPLSLCTPPIIDFSFRFQVRRPW